MPTRAVEAQLRARRRALFLATALVAFAVAFALALSNGRQLEQATGWVEHTYDVIVELRALAADLHALEAGARGFAISREEGLRRRYAAAVGEPARRLERLRGLCADTSEQLAQLASVEPLIAERLGALAATMDAVSGSAPARPTLGEAVRRGERLMTELSARLAAFESRELELLAERRSLARRSHARATVSWIAAALAGGALLGVAFRSLGREIRTRQLAEESLRGQRSLLQTILESIGEGVVAADAGGRIFASNPAAEQLLGEREEPREFLRADGRTPLPFDALPLRRALRGEVVRDEEIFVRGPSVPGGVLLLVTSTPLPRQSGAVSVFRDITERKRAEGELRAYADRVRDLYDNAPCGYHSLDAEGRFVQINQTELGWLGYRREEVVGRRLLDFVTPASRATFERNFPAFRERGAVDGLEFEMIRRDGSSFVVLLSATALRDAGGAFLASRSVLMDITERKRMERSLREARDAAESARRELESFSYSVSHDLRAPLRAIDGFSQALVEDLGDDLEESARDHLRRVRDAAQRMGQLIDDLLGLSRVSRAPLDRAPVDLGVLALEVLEELRAGEPGRAVQTCVQSGLEAHGDRRLLRVALANLIGNAWKFTRRKTDPCIEVGVLRRDGAAVFYVRDDGAGFDMAYVEKLFGAFQRLHSRSEFEGTGIGLATVARIISRHGGRCWAEGAVGRGATFYFTLGGGPVEGKEDACEAV